ncbi:hypothetical protein [Encephalitozoon cuniculi GB-M1]|uniref:Uncharacterized protein n=2 Tax=Encephalitozoon cuniculi TaxID=6035 RepID=Q8STZ6_ENCCU|nr:uncharacterized protein ECU11_1960 [Encephalitozoon cuniculi GB-M1]AGE94916.1 hypothetical protein ECU11_1960 [Encephalitozoon cuniculi]KMV65154.1 hypothetical protein M970_111960 [Encephalitozoon cuniculi EcunIII-L]UYI26406.1 proteasome regulatory subunit RPN9 [Encephalitozoon cuniculi]CAD26106.1 hypothetical protein [Encephalitozoon cuniculi GB-M1]
MEFDRIRELQRERKWMQFCCAIVDSMDSLPTDKVLNIFLESAGQVHPRSSCEVFLMFSERLNPEDGIRILAIGEEIIRNTILYSEPFEVEKMLLEMKRCLLLVEINDLKGIEKKLFEWKSLKMPKNVRTMYNLLGFKLYQKIRNIEAAFTHLLKYINLSESEDLMDTLVEYAMLSKEFFNYTLITSLPGFNKMKNRELKEIFIMFREGNVKGLEKRYNKFTEIFGSYADIVKEKAYMIALINICFLEVEKKVSVKKIEELLEISNKMAIYIVLKSFGLGLISGWIDGEEGTLYFDSLIPRALQKEEIVKLKEKYDVWEKKVHEVIAMLK